MPTIEGKPDVQHQAGPKLYFFNGSICRLWFTESVSGSGCSLCAASCPFSRGGSDAIIHETVKVAIATTGLFNGFFTNMSDLFGYGPMEDPEDWWDLSLPMFGIDTTTTSLDGGYSK
jgi:hypothetical protein